MSMMLFKSVFFGCPLLITTKRMLPPNQGWLSYSLMEQGGRPPMDPFEGPGILKKVMYIYETNGYTVENRTQDVCINFSTLATELCVFFWIFSSFILSFFFYFLLYN